MDIPFEYRNDMIIVNVVFNRIFPLKFIFDTGAENTILSKKEITDFLQVPYEREFKLLGADLQTELTAYLIRNIHIRMKDVVLPRHSMLVLDEDYFRFEEVSGLEVHGILGADVFRGLIVKINYERRVITLINGKNFKPPRGYEEVGIDVHRSKAYLNTEIEVLPGKPHKVKLLIDSGAMVPLLLNVETHPTMELPPNVLKGNVGAGLGGFIEGYLGRVSSLHFGNVECKEVITNFQDIAEGADTTVLNGRNGIIGNKVLRRFHLYIDYNGEKMYYKTNKYFKKKFEFDKSGLVVIAADTRLNKFIIHDVLSGSPGDEVGLQSGDQILRMNGTASAFLSLSSIHRRLRKKEGKQVRIVVERGNEKIKVKLKLRKLI